MRSIARRAPIRFREVDGSEVGLAELTRFYRQLYVAEFPDPNERESLANIRRYLRLRAQGWYGKNNYHVVIGEAGGKPVAGAIFDYLAVPNVGVIEFLFVNGAYRRGGLGRALLDETQRMLENDARSRLGKPLACIVAEMNDPFRHASTPDNLDPFLRCAIWGKWGYHKIEFPYVQPALSRDQEPVEILVLISKPLAPASRKTYASGWVLGIVEEYMHWAMRIDDPRANPQHRDMARYLAKHPRVPLTRLDRYVGRDPKKSMVLEEIDAGHRSFDATLRLLRREIPGEGRVCSASEFRAALSRRWNRHYTYHLWSIKEPHSEALQGMTSFFTFSSVGFGGYIVLGGRLRGRGLLRQVLARIEECMIRSATGTAGWFIECEEKAVPIFRRTGFSELSLDYRPPPVGQTKKRPANAAPAPMHLLYKQFGSVYEPPRLRKAFVLDGLAAILKHVYGIARPRDHACYARAKDTLRLTTETLVAIAD